MTKIEVSRRLVAREEMAEEYPPKQYSQGAVSRSGVVGVKKWENNNRIAYSI